MIRIRPMPAILALAGLATLAGGVLAATTAGDPTSRPPAAAAPPSVRTVTPQRVAAGGTLRLPAVAGPADEAFIHARIGGFVMERRAELGDRVAAGQTLVLIDAPELLRDRQRLAADLAEADAQVRLSIANLRRSERLSAQGHVSRSVLDEREAEARVASANRDAIAADLARTDERLAFREVRAPFDGVLVERRANVGDLVAGDEPQAGSHLFRIARMDALRVVVEVPQSAVAAVRVGAAASLSFPEFPGESFDGTVARSSGLVDRASGTMRVELTVPNPDGRLPAGMAGQVAFTRTDVPASLRVPLGAVVKKGGKPAVLLVGADGRTRFTEVRLGRNLGPAAEILAGLDETARVVVNPNSLLSDGELVQLASGP